MFAIYSVSMYTHLRLIDKHWPAAHLTNHSINKDSPSYATDKETIGGGAKWLLSRLFAYLQSNGCDTQLLWRRIRHLVVMTLLVLMPTFPEESEGCFELYGARCCPHRPAPLHWHRCHQPLTGCCGG
jgi:hypothetical protein